MSITHLHSFIQSRSDLDGNNTPSKTDNPSNCVYLHPGQTTNVTPVPELLDLERTIRETAQDVLLERRQHFPTFTFEKGRDIPKVSAFRSDWRTLVRYLLKASTLIGAAVSTDASDCIRIGLERDARSVLFLFNRAASNIFTDLDQAELTLLASRVGKLSAISVGDEGIDLQMRVSPNSGIIAPELRHSEQRITRMHVHANGNQFENRTSNIKSTG